MNSTVSLVERFQAISGRAQSPLGRAQNVVRETDELRRIRDMPRRVWEQNPRLEELIDLFTEEFRTPHGTQRLRPVQALFLEETIALRGSFTCARVGAGKTISGGLAPLAAQLAGMGLGKRAIYFTRAGVLESTRDALYAAAKHWKIQPVTLKSYSKLALDYESEILGNLQPDVIIADEADALKNTNTGAWRTLERYIRKVRQSEAFHGEKLLFLPMCGTPTDTSMDQYWHLARAALGENAPVPRPYEEKNEWCSALDDGVDEESRWLPGALVRLSPGVDESLTPIKRARTAFGRRLVETPGVITTGDSRPQNKLHITALPLEAPPKVAEAIKSMRETWTTPDDYPFEMAMELWRHARELQCGFFNRWEPRPPVEWLLVRKAWWQRRDDVRARYRLTTPGHVVKLIKSGAFDVKEPELVAAWNDWALTKPTFKYTVVPEWIDDTMTQACAEWIEKHPRGLLWVEFPALGDRLSELTGVPFYHSKALDSDRRHLERDHKAGYPAIASVKACSYGLNLQYKFDTALYPTPMSTNTLWEQSLGRYHRDGQPSPIVTAETWMVCDEAYQSMCYAINRAEHSQDTLQQSQKLCYADVRDFSAVEKWRERDTEGGLWATVAGASAAEVVGGEEEIEDDDQD